MKTIIFYATKYGASQEIAQRIDALIPDSTVCNLKTDKKPSLDNFDCVIVGGSLYAGMLRKEAKKYVSENSALLSRKKLGLFLSGISPEEAPFKQNFPENILQSAKAKMSPGGIFDPAKASGFDKFIFKTVTKQVDYVNNISDNKIAQFVSELL